MNLITLTLSKNHLWSALSIAGLVGVSYLTNRYAKNTEKTTNQTYYKPIEISNNNSNSNMNNINTNININYIFWNGDISSTYLLIDLLLQDKVIQPLYLERYTIIKNLEKDKLEKLARDNIEEKNILKDSKGNYKNKNNTIFLNSISSLKKNQEYEIKQIELLRLMILGQYPEFRNNLLPTTYITTIAKDLEDTSKFYNALLEIKPIHSEGIDFIEQVIRFLKYYNKIRGENGENWGNGNSNSNNNMSRIILGCNKDYKNRELLIKLAKKNIIDINIDTNINTNISKSKKHINLDMPVLDMDNKIVKFMAVKFFPNDIMQYFMQIENK
jgi:hypothetical protein